jgi:integrase
VARRGYGEDGIAFITLCLLTGIRSEEARALTWGHVDLKARTVSVWRIRHDGGNAA